MSGLTLVNAHEFVGREVALTGWVCVDQVQTNLFGEVTRWRTPAHCDPVWAATESPWGGTILHGFLMLALLSHFTDAIRPADGAHSVNYGLDRVRVLRPVLIGDGVRLRDRISLVGVIDKGEGRKLFKTAHNVEADGDARPVFYAEYLNYWFPR